MAEHGSVGVAGVLDDNLVLIRRHFESRCAEPHRGRTGLVRDYQNRPIHAVMTPRRSNRIFAALFASLLLFVSLSAAQAAAAVRVTLQLDATNLKVGQFTTAHVMAEIVTDQKTNTTQIFSWYVDLLNSAPTIFQIDPTTIIVPKSDSDPSTSSKGTFTSGNLRAVYDTFFNTPEIGRASCRERV